MSTAKVFLDTAYAIALSSPRDQHHRKAVELAEHLETNGTKLVTTRAVVLEIGNALAKQRYRAAAVALLQSLEQDANIEIVPLTEDVYERGFKLFQQREDKEWGLTDCLSFVIMQEHGLNEALTTDEHFEQAGFRTLLKDM
jgi:predicted nucleic acid-binding protein